MAQKKLKIFKDWQGQPRRKAEDISTRNKIDRKNGLSNIEISVLRTVLVRCFYFTWFKSQKKEAFASVCTVYVKVTQFAPKGWTKRLARCFVFMKWWVRVPWPPDLMWIFSEVFPHHYMLICAKSAKHRQVNAGSDLYPQYHPLLKTQRIPQQPPLRRERIKNDPLSFFVSGDSKKSPKPVIM